MQIVTQHCHAHYFMMLSIRCDTLRVRPGSLDQLLRRHFQAGVRLLIIGKQFLNSMCSEYLFETCLVAQHMFIRAILTQHVF